jgi:hypothetical protein
LGGYALMKNYEWTMDSLTFLTDVRLQAALSRSRPRANERDELSFARTGPLILCAQLSHPSYPPRHRRHQLSFQGYQVRAPIPRAWECFVLLRKSFLLGLSTGLLV